MRVFSLPCALLIVLATAVAAAPAQGAFGITGFNVTFTKEGGAPATTAGSHPYAVTTAFGVNFTGTGIKAAPDEELKGLDVELPAGVTGNPTATPTCAHPLFLKLNPLTSLSACPDEAAVGYVVPSVNEPGLGEVRPVYNLVPPPGVAAELGFVAASVPVTIDVRVKDRAPYNTTAASINIPQAVEFYGAEVTLWGNPNSPVHDGERGKCLGLGGSCPTMAPERPFLVLPRACAAPLRATYAATSWQNPAAAPLEGSSETPLVLSECESLGFGPTIDAQPTSRSAESPSGLDFDLNIHDPGLTEPNGTADSDIKKTVVALPEGVTTNPSVASGLGACTQAQFESETVDSEPGTGCPESSKVGTVEVETPLLEEPDGSLKVLHGAIYVAKQHDNEFDNLLTIDMVIKDPALGILVRAAGKVEPDQSTGQLTATFDDLPQVPFSHFHLHFREGERAPLITPPTCGSFSTNADLVPYSKPNSAIHGVAMFAISAGAGNGRCAQSRGELPNAPGFSAGTLDAKGGSYSPFVLNLSRDDGSQQFSAVTTTLPQGLTGKLAGIPYCSDAQISQAAARSGEGQGVLELSGPSCPAASQVGTVTVSSGAGTAPLFVQGRAYLAGPYKGAPLSLEIITPALAGPFDLGVVAVRAALQVDLRTAQVTAISDPLPTMLFGFPLDVRSIALNMSRPQFTVNPTSCEPKAITGSVTSTLGSIAPVSQYFQATDCGALKFHPKLTLSLKGKTKRSGHPALKAVVTYPKGAYANIARAQVGLPHGEFLDQGNLDKVCTQPDLKAGTCPTTSIYGRVKAWTPLLDKPLQGPVYLGVGFGYKLPALVADLDGQIRVLLVGKIDTDRQRGIRSTFEAVPDAPVSRVVLEMKGGKKYGLLENSENICRKAQRAAVTFVGQNGKRITSQTPIGDDCKSKVRVETQHKR